MIHGRVKSSLLLLFVFGTSLAEAQKSGNPGPVPLLKDFFAQAEWMQAGNVLTNGDSGQTSAKQAPTPMKMALGK